MSIRKHRWMQKPTGAGHRGIVLAGGGARGAYQIGAWKVLRRNGFRYDGFCGTSVGALNASLMAQDDYDVVNELYNSINLRDVLVMPPGLKNVQISKLNFKDMVRLYGEIVRKGGLDSSPLLKLIRQCVNEKKIRNSGKDLGFVTFAIPQFKPRKLFLSDIEEGSLPEYLYASASVPLLFKTAKIAKQKFTDGGVSDNLPAAMLQERGYRDLTLIDISAAGVIHRPEIEQYRLLYLKNSRVLPHMMNFSPSAIGRSKKMGELDCRKILGELRGIRYYIDIQKDASGLLKKIESEKELFPAKTIPEGFRHHRPRGAVILECAAMAYGIEDMEAYSVDQLMEAIRDRNSVLDTQLSRVNSSETINISNVKTALWTIVKDKMGDLSVLKTHPPILWLKAAHRHFPKYANQIKSSLNMLYPELEAAYTFAVLCGLEKNYQ